MTEIITFGIYDPNSKDAKATIVNGQLESIKLIVKAPKRFYNSLLNDAGRTFQELYPKYN